MFSYILVVSTGYILLIYICPMWKTGKMQGIASCATLANLFKNYFKGAWLWLLFVQLYKNFIVLVLELSAVNILSRILENCFFPFHFQWKIPCIFHALSSICDQLYFP